MKEIERVFEKYIDNLKRTGKTYLINLSYNANDVDGYGNKGRHFTDLYRKLRFLL